MIVRFLPMLALLILLLLTIAATYATVSLRAGDTLPFVCDGVPRVAWRNPQAGSVICDPYPSGFGTPAPKPTTQPTVLPKPAAR